MLDDRVRAAFRPGPAARPQRRLPRLCRSRYARACTLARMAIRTGRRSGRHTRKAKWRRSAAVEHLLAGFRSAAPRASPTADPPGPGSQRVRSMRPGGHQTGRNFHGDTLVACAFRFDRVVVAHVGDSRCYLIRRGQARCSRATIRWLNEQARIGILTAQGGGGIRHTPRVQPVARHRYVRQHRDQRHQIMPGDVLLLCCDGLYHSVRRRKWRRCGPWRRPEMSPRSGLWTLRTSGMAVII